MSGIDNQKEFGFPIMEIRPYSETGKVGNLIGWSGDGDNPIIYDTRVPWEVYAEKVDSCQAIFRVCTSAHQVTLPKKDWKAPERLVLTKPGQAAMGQLVANLFLEQAITAMMSWGCSKVIEYGNSKISIWLIRFKGIDSELQTYVTEPLGVSGWNDASLWREIFDFHSHAIRIASRDLCGKLTSTLSS